MKRLLVAAGVAMFAVCAAGADTVKDGSVSAEAGSLVVETGNQRDGHSDQGGTSNVSSRKRPRSRCRNSRPIWRRAARWTMSAQIPTGYLFKLKCSGKTKGDADATLVHTDQYDDHSRQGLGHAWPDPGRLLDEGASDLHGRMHAG